MVVDTARLDTGGEACHSELVRLGSGFRADPDDDNATPRHAETNTPPGATAAAQGRCLPCRAGSNSDASRRLDI